MHHGTMRQAGQHNIAKVFAKQLCINSERAPVCVARDQTLRGQHRQAAPLAIAHRDHLEQVQATRLSAAVEALPAPWQQPVKPKL